MIYLILNLPYIYIYQRVSGFWGSSYKPLKYRVVGSAHPGDLIPSPRDDLSSCLVGQYTHPVLKNMSQLRDDDRNPIFMGKCQIDGNQTTNQSSLLSWVLVWWKITSAQETMMLVTSQLHSSHIWWETHKNACTKRHKYRLFDIAMDNGPLCLW